MEIWALKNQLTKKVVRSNGEDSPNECSDLVIICMGGLSGPQIALIHIAFAKFFFFKIYFISLLTIGCSYESSINFYGCTQSHANPIG